VLRFRRLQEKLDLRNATAIWVKRRFTHVEYALRVKLCFTDGEIIPPWAKRSLAQLNISNELAEQRGCRRLRRDPQPTMLYQKRQVVLYNMG
jgi:hypothetical protein